MSGLLALVDDVAAIAKVAAASIDDVAGQAARAGAKAAGALIDDAAVAPKYVHGFPAARELPIVGRIALGSVRNKLLILLPVALLLSAFAPWAIGPLLSLGGAYLCFEGAEKLAHVLFPRTHGTAADGDADAALDGARLEEARVRGAIKTDFVLSAEIMTIALAAIPHSDVWIEAMVLAVVALGITAAVYGGVAVIVKADDVGLHLARHSGLAPVRAFGRGLVRAMPGFLRGLSAVGTAAMLWVGGSIVLHGLEGFGIGGPARLVEALAGSVAHPVPGALAPAVHWTAVAACGAVFAMALGAALMAGARVAGALRRMVAG